jgi:hypothetical protein
MTETRWRNLAYCYAAASALLVAYYVARIPVQVSDSLGNMLQVQQSTYAQLWESQLGAAGYLRPLLWLQIKAAYELASGHYWLTFKTIHALQLLALTLLFVRLLRVRSLGGFAAATFAIAVLFGMHTFNGTVREAFPINSFLTVLVAVLAVVNLAMSRHRVINDVAAPLLLAAVTMTVESGLLIAVAVVAAWVTGLRGVSRWGVAACVTLTLGYFYLRFGPLDVGSPALLERSSGFGFTVLDGRQLMDRFGSQPLPFYFYNVATSFLSVLFSEPRAGVFHAVRTIVAGETLPDWLLINLLTSAALTVLVAPFTVRAFGRWRRGEATDADRVTLVGLALLGANAVLSFAYTKDVIMSVGGACVALVAGVAAAEAVRRRPAAAWRRAVWQVALVTLSLGWIVRAAALPHLLWDMAFKTRNDWATVHQWLDKQEIEIRNDDARRFVERLRREALAIPMPHPNLQRPPYLQYLDLN